MHYKEINIRVSPAERFAMNYKAYNAYNEQLVKVMEEVHRIEKKMNKCMNEMEEAKKDMKKK